MSILHRLRSHARYLAMTRVLSDYVDIDTPTLLFGRGPGSVTEYFSRFNYEAYEPTWGKLADEYGLVG